MGVASSQDDIYPTLNYYEVKALKDDENFILIDVRQPEEWKTDGYIPGAISIPRGFFYLDNFCK